MSTDNDDLMKFIAALSLLIGGLCVVGWQVYEYMRYNIWNPISVATALEWMNIKWALNPTDWVGLFNILKIIPLSLTLIAMSWIVAIS